MPETTPLIKAALNLRAGAGFDVYKIPFITIECSRNSPPIFTNFYEQAANFDEIIYHPEKYGTIDIRYIL